MTTFHVTPRRESAFWRKVRAPIQLGFVSPCWEWIGNLNDRGYGMITVGRKQVRAHRVAWQLYTGRAPPAGRFVCHACDNPRCVSPLHLFLGTAADNARDMRDKGRANLPPPSSSLRGEDHPRAKLTAAKVAAIRYLIRNRTGRDLAKIYGVSESTISAIKTGQQWRTS